MNTNQTKPNGYRPRYLQAAFAFAALVAWSSPSLLAQQTPAAPPPNDESEAKATEEIVTLSPFEVVSAQDTGYAATSSLAGSRLNTELKDVASAIQVVTSELMKDTDSTNLQDILVFTTNTEVGGISGNFYGGSADDHIYRNRMLVNPQTGTRVRGLNQADLTRNFFTTSVPMDSYNTSRVDIQRGSNSILFGLGSPAGIINNTLKDPNLEKFTGEAQVRMGSYGSLRGMVDANVPLVPGQLSLRLSALRDKEEFDQDFTFNRDERVYGALRWQPKLADRIFTQIDIKGEVGRIKGNRPVATTGADFISNWFGPLNRYLTYDPLTQNGVPTDPNGVQHRELSHYFAGAPGRDWWNSSPGTIYQDPNSAVIGNGALDAYRQRDGSPWGGLSGVTNPNLDEGGTGTWNKNTAAYFANNPVIAGIISDFESTTGETFRGFGAAQWPTQMILDGPLAFIDRTIPGPNKEEWNDFETLDLSFTQTYLDGNLGINAGYYRESYDSGFANAINSPRVSVDVNATLRDGSANPDVGRPYIVSSTAGNMTQEDREAWRATAYYKFDLGDHIGRDKFLSKLFGEQTFTGVVSSQRYENFSRNFDLYAWDARSYGVPFLNSFSHQAWWGLHYIGDSLLNVPSFNAVPASAIQGITAVRDPGTSQNVLVWDQSTTPGTWHNAQVNILNWRDNLSDLYTGGAQGFDETDSTAFVWQGKLLNDAIVPLFGWRRDKYEQWNKPSNMPRDQYGAELPYSPDWNFASVTPLEADEQRRSWGVVLHTNQILDLFGQKLPGGIDLSLTWNDSNSFRPSEVGADINGNQFPAPSGETKDYGFILSAFENKVTLRMNWYETTQKNTRLPRGPSLGWVKGGVARTMNTLAQETWGAYTHDNAATAWDDSGSQTTPEWLVNEWFFGDSYDTAIANTPLPADWQSQSSTILAQPLRIRSAAVPGSANYTPQGTMRPDAVTGLPSTTPYLAPPLTEQEVAYREAWFAARTDAEWFRPLDPTWVAAQQFAKITGDDFRIWGENSPAGRILTNDLVSKGVEIELTANPTPSWRLTLNAARVQAVRSNILPDWEAFVAENRDLWLDGFDNNPGGPSQLNYWTIDGFADLRHWAGTTTYSSVQDTFGGRMMQDVYGPYVNAIAGEGLAVSELRKWRLNFVTNYSFTSGFLENINIGGAVRWQDKPAIGYLPQYNTDAGIWVTNVSSPLFGPTETNFDAWIGYRRKLTEKLTWEIQLNIRDAFADDDLIPIMANPDGTIAQVRIPANTTWAVTNTFRF
jgi:outer membrane receptor protein involved in Fe transport